jgi:SWI/SNF-related matrix-associated actin-dependent regulator of chromatin subfamily D
MLQDPNYTAMLRQVVALDDQLAILIQAINQSKARYSFHSSMAQDPVRFIKKWTSSQKRDLEVILGETTKGGGDEWLPEEFRRGGKDSIWASDLVRESVGLMVARRTFDAHRAGAQHA